MRAQRVVVIATTPAAAHQAGLFRQLTVRLAVVLHEPAVLPCEEVSRLRALGVDVVQGPAVRVVRWLRS